MATDRKSVKLTNLEVQNAVGALNGSERLVIGDDGPVGVREPGVFDWPMSTVPAWRLQQIATALNQSASEYGKVLEAKRRDCHESYTDDEGEKKRRWREIVTVADGVELTGIQAFAAAKSTLDDERVEIKVARKVKASELVAAYRRHMAAEKKKKVDDDDDVLPTRVLFALAPFIDMDLKEKD